VGVTRPEQLEENCKASALRLSPETVARIDEIAPPPARTSNHEVAAKP
jgi:aryl-alcohol dehydrogenase-like predicted oxidoreductase